MQEKNTKVKKQNKMVKNKKAPKKGASQKEKSESIFNYDVEVPSETPPEKNKKIEKLKKQKKKENIKRKREIKKQEEKEEKERIKNRKRLNSKQIEKRNKIKKVFGTFFLIAIIILAITLLLLSPIFNLKNIQVKNNNKVSSDEIISLSQLEKETSIFKRSSRAINSNIKENAYIASVQVTKSLPSTIILTVKEREVKYLLVFGNSYGYVDNEGNILEVSSTDIPEKLKITGYSTLEENIKAGNKINDEDIQKYKDITIIMNAAKNNNIDTYINSINISDTSDYTLYCESAKKKIYLGDTTNLDTKMLYAQVIMDREKDNAGEIFVNVDYKTKNAYYKEQV